MKTDKFIYKTYTDPVWLSYNFTREFYLGISLWLRVYRAFEESNGVRVSCIETIILWIPFFKFTFQYEYEVNPETNLPYQCKSPSQLWCEKFYNDLETKK